VNPPPLSQSRCIGTPPSPEQIELHRDRMWRRDEDLRIESAVDAERFIESVGFANTLTDARRAGPSLYIAVCGRRDVSLPRNVLPKGEETCASLTPVSSLGGSIKDDESIAAANENGIAMAFTGTRHFNISLTMSCLWC
jgi:hypothetical protein